MSNETSSPIERALELNRQGLSDRALRLLAPLAEAGEAEAMEAYGDIMNFGLLDMKRAISWYQKAIAAGRVSAMVKAGKLLLRPNADTTATALADGISGERLLMDAVEEGAAEAAYALSRMREGAESYGLLVQAAILGHIDAQWELGDGLMKRGDYQGALDWYRKCAAQGRDGASRLVETIERHLP